MTPITDCPGEENVDITYGISDADGTYGSGDAQGHDIERVVRLPGPPRQLTQFEYTPPTALDQSGTLTWETLPSHDGEYTRSHATDQNHWQITGYEVEYRVDDHPSWQAIDPADLDTPGQYEDTTIWKQGTTLRFRVRPSNIVTQNFADKQATWEYALVQRTDPVPTVSGLTVTPSGLIQDSAAFFPVSNLQLAWTRDTGAAGHLIYRRPLSDASAPLALIADDLAATATRHQIPVPTDSGYEYAVQAYSLAGGGPLSRATFEILPAPPDAPAPPRFRIDLRGVAGGNVMLDGPEELEAGRIHDFTVTAEVSADSPTPALAHRYGGGRRGFAFDAGPGELARWVTPDNRGACLEVSFCLFQPASAEYSYQPSDGRPARWLFIQRGSDSTDGFATGDRMQLYVQSASAAISLTYGFAELRTGETTPFWIGHGDPNAGPEYRTRRSVSSRSTLPSAMNFTGQTAAAGQVRLEWAPAADGGALQQIQRKLSSADESGWARVCCNLPATQSWIIDTPPAANAGETISYDYRIGTFQADGRVQWLGPTVTVVLTGAEVGNPATDSLPKFATADQGSAYGFPADASVNQSLPRVTGGDGTITYTTNDLSDLGLRVEVDSSGTPRLRSAMAIAGSRQGTLQATDADGDVDFLFFEVTVGTLLDQPRNLVATATGQTITLTWAAPAGVDGYALSGYRIERSPTGIGNTWTILVPLSETADARYEDRNLPGAQIWYYRVAAVNATGIGSWARANAVTALAMPPRLPTELTATSGLQSVELTWTAPAENGGADISAYVVEYSSTGASNTWQAVGEEPTATTYTHRNLWPNWGAHYRVRARNSVGVGEESATVFVATANGGTVPTDLRAVADIRQITLTWVAPPGSGTDVRYRIERSPDSTDDSWTVLVAETDNPATTYAHGGLTPDDTIHYRVSTVHRGGVSAPSNSADATVLPGENVPFAPTGLESAADFGEIVLSWAAPAADGGATITGYRIQSSDTGLRDDWENVVADTRNTIRSYPHTGLAPDERIFHRVAAINSAGVGAWSTELESVALGAQPSAPAWATDLEGDDRVIAVSDDGLTEVQVSFTTPAASVAGAITDFVVQVGFVGEGQFNREPEHYDTVLVIRNRWAPGTTRNDYIFRFDPAVPRTDFLPIFRMIARNAAGASPPSPGQFYSYLSGLRLPPIVGPTPIVQPSSPRNVEAEAGPGRVGLRWEPPEDDGGAAISGYRIERWDDGQTMWVDAVANTGITSPSHLFDNVPANVTLRYRVSAISSANISDPCPTMGDTQCPLVSDPSPLVRVSTAPATAPAPPSQLTATVATGTITLTWRAPTFTGGAEVTGYRVEHSATGALGTWQELPNEPAAATSRTHAGLTRGQRRHYRVSALNAAGESPPSAALAAEVPADLAGAPTSLTATAGQTRVFLDWVAPTELGGGTIEGYRIDRRASGVMEWTSVVAHTGVTRSRYTDTGLTAGAGVDYRVSAITSAGAGAGAEVSATPEATHPEPPTNIAVAPGASDFDISWVASASAGTGAMIASYRVERSTDGEATWTVVADNVASTSTTYTDAAIDVVESPIYRVFAVNDQTHRSIPAGFVQATGAQPPPTPINVLATGEWNQNTITWLAVPNTNDPAPTGYRVIVAEATNPTAWRILTDVDATTSIFTHTNLARLQTFHYRVATRSAVGSSLFSLPRTATTLDPEVVLDIDGVSGFDEDDTLLMYYALNFPELMGDGSAGSGIPIMRQALLGDPENPNAYVDSAVVQQMSEARRLARELAGTTVDINGDQNVDADDALIMYYAYRLSDILGNGTSGGTPALRRTFLGGLAGTANPTDAELRGLLERANQVNPE